MFDFDHDHSIMDLGKQFRDAYMLCSQILLRKIPEKYPWCMQVVELMKDLNRDDV